LKLRAPWQQNAPRRPVSKCGAPIRRRPTTPYPVGDLLLRLASPGTKLSRESVTQDFLVDHHKSMQFARDIRDQLAASCLAVSTGQLVQLAQSSDIGTDYAMGVISPQRIRHGTHPFCSKLSTPCHSAAVAPIPTVPCKTKNRNIQWLTMESAGQAMSRKPTGSDFKRLAIARPIACFSLWPMTLLHQATTARIPFSLPRNTRNSDVLVLGDQVSIFGPADSGLGRLFASS
jgi:hypothetical protein